MTTTVEDLIVAILAAELGEEEARVFAVRGAAILASHDEAAWDAWRRDLSHARFVANMDAND